MSGMKTVECLIFHMWFYQVFLELDTQVFWGQAVLWQVLQHKNVKIEMYVYVFGN